MFTDSNNEQSKSETKKMIIFTEASKGVLLWDKFNLKNSKLVTL